MAFNDFTCKCFESLYLIVTARQLVFMQIINVILHHSAIHCNTDLALISVLQVSIALNLNLRTSYYICNAIIPIFFFLAGSGHGRAAWVLWAAQPGAGQRGCAGARTLHPAVPLPHPLQRRAHTASRGKAVSWHKKMGIRELIIGCIHFNLCVRLCWYYLMISYCRHFQRSTLRQDYINSFTYMCMYDYCGTFVYNG